MLQKKKNSEFEDTVKKTAQNETQHEKWVKKNEQSISQLQDNFKKSNICVTEIPEGRVSSIDKRFKEIMAEKISKFGENYKHTDPRSAAKSSKRNIKN